MKPLRPSDIFVFGYFGYVTNRLNGQTIKTRMIHNLFEEKLNGRIPFYDTELLKTKRMSLLLSLWQLVKAKHIIYLPAQNNLKLFLPIIYHLSKIFHFKIHYFVVGGWLPEFITKNIDIKIILKKIHCIYVETSDMQTTLTNDFNFENIIWFPNFRIDYQVEKTRSDSEKFRLVFISRITLEKGVDTIFSYLDSIMHSRVYNQILFDFYGPLDSIIEDWFFSQIARHQNSNYRGVIAPEQVQSTISNYDLMVFPTRYPGEGCPGVIIEAYMACVPVLASDWRYNKEFVKEGETGYLFDPANIKQMSGIIDSLVSNRTIAIALGKNAKVYSDTFTSTKVWELIRLT